MNFEPAEKMKNFEAGIFQILDKKKKELEKINAINIVISDYDKQLKVLYDYKKQQEKIYQMYCTF